MKIGFLTVSLLLASTVFAREEDSPLNMDSTAPKIEKPQIAKPQDEAIKPKSTVITETIKAKTEVNAEEAPKKKTNPATDEVPKKKSEHSSDNITLPTTVLPTNDAPKKKTLPVIEVIVPTPPTTVSVSALANARSATAAPTSPTITETTYSQRQQQSLIDNAVKIDGMNRDLLTQNEKLQLENEKLAQQLELLQNDHSAENMRNGAFFVLLGLFCGWLLMNAPRPRKKW